MGHYNQTSRTFCQQNLTALKKPSKVSNTALKKTINKLEKCWNFFNKKTNGETLSSSEQSKPNCFMLVEKLMIFQRYVSLHVVQYTLKPDKKNQ